MINKNNKTTRKRTKIIQNSYNSEKKKKLVGDESATGDYHNINSIKM